MRGLPFFSSAFFNISLMERYNQSIDLFPIFKTRSQKEFLIKARRAEKILLQTANAYDTFRLAQILDSRGFQTKRLQAHIIRLGDSKIIYKLALTIKRTNPAQLQKALIKANNPVLLAKFACRVKQADMRQIEQIIIQSGNSRAAYFLIRFRKYCNLNKLKHIILRSNQPRYLFALARVLTNSKDLKLIQGLILQTKNPTYARLFAKYIKGATILVLEECVIQSMDIDEIRKFAKELRTSKALKAAMLC